MEKLWEVVQAVLHRAVLAVGVLSTLLTLATAGLLLAWRNGDPAWLLLALFGTLGSAEVFHRQQKTDLVERREVEKKSLLLDIQAAHPRWKPKVLKEFEHGGLLFRAAGFGPLVHCRPTVPPMRKSPGRTARSALSRTHAHRAPVHLRVCAAQPAHAGPIAGRGPQDGGVSKLTEGCVSW